MYILIHFEIILKTNLHFANILHGLILFCTYGLYNGVGCRVTVWMKQWCDGTRQKIFTYT